MKTKIKDLSQRDIDRIVGMAWEDRTTFDAIERQFGIPEKEVIKIMRREMHPNNFKHWRKHVTGRKTKHQALRSKDIDRFRCSRQKNISLNKISKR